MFLLKRMIFFVALIKIAFCSSGTIVKTPLEVTHIAWIQIYFAPYDHYLGIVEFGLFGKIYPKTVRNFVELANVTKIGAGFKDSKLLVKHDVIVGGLLKGGRCTIYGKHYGGDEGNYKSSGQGWLSLLSIDGGWKFTSFFLVSLLDSSSEDRIYGKVIRGMTTIEHIRFLYNTVEKSEWNSEFYITDCGAKIPHKKFYVSTDSSPSFS